MDYLNQNYKSYIENNKCKAFFIDEDNFELIKDALEKIFEIKSAIKNDNGLETLMKMMPKGKPIEFGLLRRIKKKKDYYESEPVSSLIKNDDVIIANKTKTLDLFYNR